MKIGIGVMGTVLLALATWGCDDGSTPVNLCAGVTCSGHGTCVIEGEAARCDCDVGYELVTDDPHECTLEPYPPDLETILADAHLVQVVELGATVDLEGILAADLGATREGDFVWWEEPLDRFSMTSTNDCGQMGYIPDDVMLRYAIDSEGLLVVGALGPPSKALTALLFAHAGVNDYPYSTDDWRENAYYGGRTTLDHRFTLMFFGLWYNFVALRDGGLVTGGPEDFGEFMRLELPIENRYEAPVFIVNSANCCCAAVNACDDTTPVNQHWCSQPGADAGGLGARGFDLSYEGAVRSALVLHVAADTDNRARIRIDNEDALDCGQAGGAQELLIDTYPEQVNLEINRAYSALAGDYSQVFTQFLLFVVADNVTASDWWEDPETGLSQNPAPMVDSLEPGWNF